MPEKALADDDKKAQGQLWTDDEYVYVHTLEGNRAFIRELRLRVPEVHFDSASATWVAPLAFQDVVTALFHEHCSLFPDRLQVAYYLFHLLPGAPIEIVEAAYRAYAEIYDQYPARLRLAKAAFRRIKEAIEALREEALP